MTICFWFLFLVISWITNFDQICNNIVCLIRRHCKIGQTNILLKLMWKWKKSEMLLFGPIFTNSVAIEINVFLSSKKTSNGFMSFTKPSTKNLSCIFLSFFLSFFLSQIHLEKIGKHAITFSSQFRDWMSLSSSSIFLIEIQHHWGLLVIWISSLI